ncbi:MAG: endopeptidase La [Planctomycetes bacterium]|nr:endopeptidase La [Planctomycetota bacterium]
MLVAQRSKRLGGGLSSAAMSEEAESPAIVVGGEAAQALTVAERLPTRAFVFPLRKSVPFPNLMMPVLVDDEAGRTVVQQAEAADGHLLLLTQRDPETEKPGAGSFYEVGVIGRILKTFKLPDGNASVMVQGRARARVTKFLREQHPLLARVVEMPDVPTPGPRVEAVFRKLQQALEQVAEATESLGNDFRTAVLNIEEPAQLADFCGAYLLKKTEQRQELLSIAEVGPRVERALQFVLAELEIAELGNRIQAEIRQKVEKAQKDWFLREQIKLIRKELGEEVDAREAELQRLETAIEAAGMPEVAGARAREELQKLRTTPAESPEYSVLRNYLDWLTALPWSRSSVDTQDLRRAAAILDEDHYGLDEVKQRILEFLAVRKLKPAQSGSILCFAGPPGVGKTSLGRSIARAMGREFWRFSLGGMRDEAEIKGHRRTYIGAMPGRILQGLKTSGTNNPVLMLDEIDKLGADFRGDPSSALLEVLDPEQNHAFLDHYLDVPFDLSRVLFLATANALPQIPEPLRDRMEVIELPGYLAQEKVEIALRHVLPKQLDRHGLTKKHLSLGQPALRQVVHLWTREAGVRGLEKAIVRMCRKAAAAVAARRKPPGRVTLDRLEDLLGPPRFPADQERKLDVPGVVQGLAWTPHGGDVLYIEAARIEGGQGLTLTGSLGEVMAESVRIALHYLRGHAAEYGIDPERFDKAGFHVHFPAGAIPKDGPSAGITIATALCSLLTGRPAPQDLAMTGELTLVGEVLPIGGVREKLLAARRYRLKRVILPEHNRRDVGELRKDLLAGLRLVYVERFADVVREAFAARRRSAPARRRRGRGAAS